MQEKNRLSTIISIASLMTAAIAAGISNRVLPPTAFWAAATAFFGVLAIFLSPLVRDGWSRYRKHRRATRISATFHTRLTSLASVIAEITRSSSDSRSIGSILNTAHTYKSMKAHAVNGYLAHLGALGGWSTCVHRRAVSEAATGAGLAHELIDIAREYTRLCNLVSADIEAHFDGSAAPGRALEQAWMQILRQVNGIADELMAVTRLINLEDPETNLPVYVVPANDLSLHYKSAGVSAASGVLVAEQLDGQ